MARIFEFEEVAKHNTKNSCWVILYGKVYDVTGFLNEHPGGPRIILSLAGRDATEDYDPVHPPGTLEASLKPEALLGTVSSEGFQSVTKKDASSSAEDVSKQVKRPSLKALLNMDDVEAAAVKIISKKCWAYYYSGSDDMVSKSLNNAVYRSILLRPRVFVDSTTCDTSTSIIGHKVGTPLYVSPTAMARLAHSEGEWGIARGISRFGAAQLVSNHASMNPEQVVNGAQEGQVFGWQLYVQNDRSKSEAMLARITKPEMRRFYKFIVLTLDAPWPGKRELDERMAFEGSDMRDDGDDDSDDEDHPGKGGGIGQQSHTGTAADLTWATTLPWLRKHTNLPIVLKGIQTHEDALLAAQHTGSRGNVQAIILSNHGGRGADTAPPPVHTLLEIRKYCPEVFDKLEVWVDGGIKRGTDVVKALCLGARAVGIGRLPLWGLGVRGNKGVERVFEILQDEIDRCMRLLGARCVADLNPQMINTRKVEMEIFHGMFRQDNQSLVFEAKL